MRESLSAIGATLLGVVIIAVSIAALMWTAAWLVYLAKVALPWPAI